jgi:hypothetical protein
MSDLDERLRSALTDLGSAAEHRVRPAGAASVPPAGRRRRRAVRTATGVLVLVLAGGAAVGGRVAVADPPVDRAEHTAVACKPLLVIASLPPDASAEQVGRVAKVLTTPEVTEVVFRSSTGPHDRYTNMYMETPTAAGLTNAWRFTVNCEDDFPALRARLEAESARVWRLCLDCPVPTPMPVRVYPSESTPR